MPMGDFPSNIPATSIGLYCADSYIYGGNNDKLQCSETSAVEIEKKYFQLSFSLYWLI